MYIDANANDESAKVTAKSDASSNDDDEPPPPKRARRCIESDSDSDLSQDPLDLQIVDLCDSSDDGEAGHNAVASDPALIEVLRARGAPVSPAATAPLTVDLATDGSGGSSDDSSDGGSDGSSDDSSDSEDSGFIPFTRPTETAPARTDGARGRTNSVEVVRPPAGKAPPAKGSLGLTRPDSGLKGVEAGALSARLAARDIGYGFIRGDSFPAVRPTAPAPVARVK